MTAFQRAAGRVLYVVAGAFAVVGAGSSAAQAAEPAAPEHAFQEVIFVGLAEDPVEKVAILEAEADARAQAADAGFVACSVVDVEVIVPPGLPEPEPFPIETVFGARVTISCAD